MEAGALRGFDLDDARRTDNQILMAAGVGPHVAAVGGRTTYTLPPSCIREGGEPGVSEKEEETEGMDTIRHTCRLREGFLAQFAIYGELSAYR